MSDPVKDAIDLSLEIRKNEVDDRQIRFCNLRIASFCDREMFVAAFPDACISAPIIGNDHCARYMALLTDPTKRFFTAIWDDGKTNPPCISPVFTLVETGARFAPPDFHGTGNKNLVVNATTFSARSTTNQPKFRRLRHVRWDSLCSLDLGEPCQRALCGGIWNAVPRNEIAQVGAETAWQTYLGRSTDPGVGALIRDNRDDAAT